MGTDLSSDLLERGHVSVVRQGSIVTVTLDRPDAKNRLDAESMGLLLEHLRATAEDPGVRVVVLTGSGTTFCSGADLAGAVAARALRSSPVLPACPMA